MMIQINDIADAFVAALNAGTNFSLTFTASRKYAHQISTELTDYDDLTVYVVPQSQSLELNSRDADKHETVLRMSVIKKTLSAATNAEIDTLVDFTGELLTFALRRKVTVAGSSVVCVGVSQPAILSPDDLSDRLFFSQMDLTFRGYPTNA